MTTKMRKGVLASPMSKRVKRMYCQAERNLSTTKPRAKPSLLLHILSTVSNNPKENPKYMDIAFSSDDPE
jgi:hypothetical protein